jgi:fructan beta-fructosidase
MNPHNKIHKAFVWIVIVTTIACGPQQKVTTSQTGFNEPHRPQIHFSPIEKWMNDPNGMVYHNGTYHLFYQYYPDSTVWGPMHWGHATSKNLVHWTHQPIALFPDSLGYIFSGSAVVDVNNTSGFGRIGQAPMVAIFTHHNPKGEKEGRNDFQYQSLAYSIDEGKSWTKYSGNPVIKNPGIRDFRDPKVMWHELTRKWIMTLATLDRVTFYSSPDLKSWTKESEFGKEVGAHGGVWECPDLFPLEHGGKTVWVLLVSINPGGPNGGSATQYFTGDFDGHRFTPFQTDTRWIDYGPDDYAGVTWSNTGRRKIFMGWMSNWSYAQQVPTRRWRSAMTLPRDLGLEKIGERYFVTSQPVSELKFLENQKQQFSNVDATSFDLSSRTGNSSGPSILRLKADEIQNFSINLINDQGQRVVIGYEKTANQFFIDRAASGNVGFAKEFGGRHKAPRLGNSKEVDLTLVIDNASVELFADNGLSILTSVFFPDGLLSTIQIRSTDGFLIKSLVYTKLKSIYIQSR